MHQTVASTSSTALLSRRMMSGEKILILSPAAASCGLAGCLAASETKDEESWRMLSREESSSPLELADILWPPPYLFPVLVLSTGSGYRSLSGPRPL